MLKPVHLVLNELVLVGRSFQKQTAEAQRSKTVNETMEVHCLGNIPVFTVASPFPLRMLAAALGLR